MNRCDIITIGSATRDALFRSNAFSIKKNPGTGPEDALIFPLGSKIPIDNVFFSTGGGATNTAVTFARQGFSTVCIARIGDDVSGETIRRELKKERIDVRFLQVDDDLPTAYSVILEPSSGERVILNYRGANEELSAKKIPFLSLRSKLIYLSSLSGKMAIMEKAIMNKKKFGTRIAWNPGGSDLKLGLAALLPFMKMVDVFIVNQEEASSLLGIPYKEVDDIFKKFDECVDGIAVMTMGPKGVYVSNGNTLWKTGTFPEKQIIDRTGAGDSFGAGFIAGLMHAEKKGNSFSDRSSIEYAIRLASANATSKVEHLGAKCGLLTKREFETQKRWKTLPMEIKTI